MELVRGLHNLRTRSEGCALTIGAFDGIHLGHQEMLRVLRVEAQRYNVPAVVLSFEPTPREFFAKENAPARLTRFREKFALLQRFGVDRFVCLRFDAQLRSLSKDQFIAGIVCSKLGARHVIVGHDFRFARNLEGTVESLRESGAHHGFGVTEVAPFKVGDERVSSSAVRGALERGELEHARRLLGRRYCMTGKVIHGAKLGRKLGYPTANLRLHRRTSPLLGVFAVRASGAGLQNAPAVASLGTRPVVNGQELLLEVHVFDADLDLYGAYLDVEFVAKLRDEQWFASMDELVRQMDRDAAAARAILKRLAVSG
ncbi:MAG TPA: bifunctional riboflavin kinase/FAD synthetase [Steroidobacteraceae bacterium]|nr:bifunctional riboflavin kinase/FAD synthetase [Steroidobacteraceae bacterium]